MKISILSSQHFITSPWSGGSTTELYIFPAKATYLERNFDFRISTAKVEVAESTFTALPGIHRKLMILDGEITIMHKNQYTKNLKPFDVDSFCGDWNTTSIGICTDFNVMTTNKWQNELYYLAKGAVRNFKLIPRENCSFFFLYAIYGNIRFQLLNETYFLETGNVLVIENINVTSISIDSDAVFELVVVEIQKS